MIEINVGDKVRRIDGGSRGIVYRGCSGSGFVSYADDSGTYCTHRDQLRVTDRATYVPVPASWWPPQPGDIVVVEIDGQQVVLCRDVTGHWWTVLSGHATHYPDDDELLTMSPRLIWAMDPARMEAGQ